MRTSVSLLHATWISEKVHISLKLQRFNKVYFVMLYLHTYIHFDHVCSHGCVCLCVYCHILQRSHVLMC